MEKGFEFNLVSIKEMAQFVAELERMGIVYKVQNLMGGGFRIVITGH